MKLIFSLLLIAGCAGASSEIDYTGETGPYDPEKNVVVVLHDQIGTAYRLVSATYLLDGDQILYRANANGWDDLPEELRVFRTSAPAGPHRLMVMLDYQPNEFGIFTYVRGYKLKLRSATEFVVRDGGPTSVHAVVTAKGNLTAQLDERPEVAYHVD